MNANKTNDSNLTQSNGVSLDFSELYLGDSNRRTMSNLQNLMRDNFSGTLKFSLPQILEFLERPRRHSNNLVEASKYLSASSGYYMRLMHYMSRMLTLDYVLLPKGVTELDMHSSDFRKAYHKADNYLDSLKIKHEFGQILYIMVVEDVYFGYERRNSKGEATFQRLPSRYCRISGKQNGNFIFEFNMSYFGNDIANTKSFPREFTTLYRKYMQGGEVWQQINPNKGVCFKFREDLNYNFPPFSAVMADVLDHQDLKDLMKSKNKIENFKLLLQKIPFKDNPRSSKDFLIDLPSVRIFHDNIKSVLPDEIGLISTPMKVEDYSFERKNNTLNNYTEQSKNEIFDSVGMPSALFSSQSSGGGAVALNKAIQTDEALMFQVLRQFETFFNNRLSHYVTDYGFKVIMPDITVYNREDKLESYLNMAQYGIPPFFLAAALGVSAQELSDMAMFETDFLNLGEKLKPLQSSHTMGKGDKKKSGGQEKSDNKLSDSGDETRVKGANIKS